MAEPARCHPVAPWPEAFSDRFIEQARRLLDVRPALAIVGPVGASRSHLAALVADAPDDSLWWRHVARYGERDEPYFAARQILRALRTSADDPPNVVEDAAVEAVHRLGIGRLTIQLANADLCDRPSIELLTRLALRGEIRIIATLTPEAADSLPGLLAAAEIVELPPLAPVTVAALLRLRYGLEPHPTVVDVVLERSEGAYGVIREIVDAACTAGALTEIEGVMALNAHRSQDAVRQFGSFHSPRSIERLGGAPRVSDLLELTAVIGHLDAGEARDCLGTETVGDALAHGALREVEDTISFTVKAEAALVAQGLTQEHLTALFERYAHRLPVSMGRLGNAVRVADWWRSTGRLLPVDLAARAARAANLTGRYHRAAVFTQPGVNVDDAPVAPIERAFALIELGDHDGLDELFEALDPGTLGEDELVPYLRWLGRAGEQPDRRQVEQLVVPADADPTTRRRREAVMALADLLARAFDEAGDDVQAGLRSLAFSAHLSTANRALTFTTLSAVQRNAGLARQAVQSADFALDLLDGIPESVSAFHLDLARECQILALICAVDLPRADRALTVYSAGVLGRVGSGRLATALRGILELFRGDVQQALVNARLCLTTLEQHDPHHLRGWVEAILAQVLVQVGRVDEARVMLERSERHPALHLQHDLERRIAQACVHDSLAAPELALEILADVATGAAATGLRLAQIDAAVLSVQIGGPPHLGALLEAVDELIDPSGTPAIWQEFARSARDYDIAGLVRLAERLDHLDARLLAAEVAQFTLDVARRATDLDTTTRARLRRLADPMSHRNAMAEPRGGGSAASAPGR